MDYYEKKFKKALEETPEETEENLIEISLSNNKTIKCHSLCFIAGKVEGEENVWISGLSGKYGLKEFLTTSHLGAKLLEQIDEEIKERIGKQIKENIEIDPEAHKKFIFDLLDKIWDGKDDG